MFEAWWNIWTWICCKFTTESASEKIWKSDSCWSYGQEFGVLFFLTHGVVYKNIITLKLLLFGFRYQSVSTSQLGCKIMFNCNQQEAQLSPRDRAMRRVSWNLASCHATVQYDKSWTNRSYEVGGKVGWCVINMCTQPWRDRVASMCHKQTTTVELCISPVYRRLAVAKFSKSTSTM